MDKKNFVLYDAGGDLSKRWYVHFRLDGKRVLRYGDINKYSTQAGRYNAAKELIKQLNNTQFAPSQIEKRVFEYLEAQKHRWRIKTYQGYHSKMSIFFRWLNGSTLTNNGIIDFFEQQRPKLQPKTYNEYINTLSLIFRALDIDMPKIEKLRVSSTPARYFTQSQRDFLAKELKERDSDLWLFVQFVFYCFIRPGELRALKVGDIIIDDAKVLLRSEISKNKKEQYVCIPAVFLPAVAKAIEGRNPANFVFGNGRKMLGASTMVGRHQAILKELRFDTDKYKLYSWKHTGAVACAKKGIPIKQLQIQLRHHSLDQVNDYLRQLGADDCDQIQNNFPSI